MERDADSTRTGRRRAGALRKAPGPVRAANGLALAVVLWGVAVLGRATQQPQPQPPPPPPELKPQAPTVPPLPQGLSEQWSIWKSETTGHEYRVRIEAQTFYAEWVNLPPGYSERGAYIHTQCRRVGDKWIGTSRSVLPCTQGEGGKQSVANWCPLVTRTEIETLTPDRITGRGQALRKFECQTCKVLETAWADFVWVPVKTEGGRR